jgi:hypothetical protein
LVILGILTVLSSGEIRSSSRVDLLTDFEQKSVYAPENWSVKGRGVSSVLSSKHASSGSKGLEFVFKSVGDMNSRAEYEVAVTADWNDAEIFSMDLYNATGHPLSFIFAVSCGGWIWHESKPLVLIPGWNRDVFVRLDRPDFKAAPDWQYTHFIRGKSQIERVTFWFLSAETEPVSGSVFIDDLRIVRGRPVSEEEIKAEEEKFRKPEKPVLISLAERSKYRPPVLKRVRAVKPAVRQYGKFEADFDIDAFYVNPFNPDEIDVTALFRSPTGRTQRVPCFVWSPDDPMDDIGSMKSWKVRFAPPEPGVWTWTLQARNPAGRAVSEEQRFECQADPEESGFVRVLPDEPRLFRLDNGEPFFPVGFNVAWGPLEKTEALFREGAKAGVNWSRVWMTHFNDNANLDWRWNVEVPLGAMDQEVARHWDRVLETAEANGIRVQMVFQHHGQFSAAVNPNWNDNPWNRLTGGFLQRPEDFFSDPVAKILTRMKYRYIVARYGYSKGLMAWEIFNEIEFTDGYRNTATRSNVFRWQAEMADYLRSIDGQHRLITSSGFEEKPDALIYSGLDYNQPHRYAQDMIPAAAVLPYDPAQVPRPVFFGEVGDDMMQNVPLGDGRYLRSMVWSGLMSGGAGAAEIWGWEEKGVPSYGVVRLYKPVTGFVKLARFGAERYVPVRPVVEAREEGSITFQPGQTWARASGLDFRIPGELEKAALIPSYLHGDPGKTADGYPSRIVFRTKSQRSGPFRIVINQVAKTGCGIRISVDGKEKAVRNWQPAGFDADVNETVSVDVPGGEHEIAVESLGPDWIRIGSFEFGSVGMPVIAAYACTNAGGAVLWAYHRKGIHEAGVKAENAKVGLTLPAGRYRIRWWDCELGKIMKEEDLSAESGNAVVALPPVSKDVAAWFERTGGRDR